MRRGKTKSSIHEHKWIMSTVLELEDYLKEEKLDIMEIVETKLASEVVY